MSSKKRISVHGLEDFKDISGKWVKSFIVITPLEYIQNYTRAGGIWDNIQNRLMESCLVYFNVVI